MLANIELAIIDVLRFQDRYEIRVCGYEDYRLQNGMNVLEEPAISRLFFLVDGGNSFLQNIGGISILTSWCHTHRL
jgi:hypothetical protein